ncbi:50S ribosomal protein L4 [Gloeobacter kilaueensis]|uniref:Large ribosomal subunit protein uL4 n=1 Tax=Gloeobacter kilaueensis (strain ATCC BAA-2537 / CCAP 1431/1 / ULC 316 / JS1) TaxID=1183438 RepID=U5QBX5_GLOK1|nr:50S ribosomal protein L4 [Gloeobacter kilaueensis]AGY56308.1 50S ribosomal protein L4 [Gloeobacter kilaueensis JS1]
MATCSIKDWQGNATGEVELDLPVASEATASHIVYLAFKRQMTNSRQGTASTLTRGEVRGGGKKPWKQKGTGRARAGSIRSPLWRKGGVIFGPKPRDFEIKMNRKERRLALRTALQSRIDDLIVVDEFESQLSKPRTRELVQAFERWGIDTANQSILLILAEQQTNTYLSARNLPNVKVITAQNLNVRDLLATDWIVATGSAIDFIKQTFGAAAS